MARFRADGNDINQLIDAFDTFLTIKGKPTVIIARTLKGKGVSFFEDKAEWHGKIPTDEQIEAAFEELNVALNHLEEN